MQLLLESVQSVDCVVSLQAAPSFLNGKRQKGGWAMHGNEATETVFNNRVSHVALLTDLLKVNCLII